MPLALTTKANKLMKLCEIEGYKNVCDLVQAVYTDSVCPATLRNIRWVLAQRDLSP